MDNGSFDVYYLPLRILVEDRRNLLKGDVKKGQTAKKRKDIENTEVSTSVKTIAKVRKTQKMSFSVKFSFLLRAKSALDVRQYASRADVCPF
jgi:hypothetical protein